VVQVMGHAKTVLVLVVSWAFFNDIMTLRKFVGMSLAVLGMVVYGVFASRSASPALPASVLDDDLEKGVKKPLLSQ
jgi:drug/metabolite transporter (DMT)-like permease